MTALASLALIALASTLEAPRERDTFTFGLDAALRLESASSFDLGAQSAAPGRVGRRTLARIRPTMTLNPAEGVAFVAQGQLYGASAGGAPRGVDLYQAFVGLVRERIELRLGRQEIVLGSGFLLGADEFFDGAAYDAIHAVVRPRPGLAFAAFGGRTVAPLSGGLGGIVSGVVVYAGREGAGVEAYVLDDSAAATSVGARAVARRGAFAVELEPVLQSGGARGGHVELGYGVARGAFRPRFTLGYAFASPDFLHPRHDTAQVGDLGVIGDLSSFSAGDATASGLRSASIGAEIPLGRRAALSVTVRDFAASEVTGASSRSVGREVDAVATFAVSDLLSIAVSVDRFTGGAFHREATGEDLRARYGHAALRCRF